MLCAVLLGNATTSERAEAIARNSRRCPYVTLYVAKERKTLEALLHTPTTDTELFLGKLMASWIPPFLVRLGVFILYALVVCLSA